MSDINKPSRNQTGSGYPEDSHYESLQFGERPAESDDLSKKKRLRCSCKHPVFIGIAMCATLTIGFASGYLLAHYLGQKDNGKIR